MREEKINFKSTGGLNLCGILSKSPKSTHKCIVLCHGIVVDKEEDGAFTNLAVKLSKAGFNVFRFDFRGHGESEGESVDLTIEGEADDIEGAFNYLKCRGYTIFGLLGASFAAGSVSLFSSAHPGLIEAIVLWNPVIDYQFLIRPKTKWAKEYWGERVFEQVSKFGFAKVENFKIGKPLLEEITSLEPWRLLQRLHIPILVIHGDKDTFVPYKDSVRYTRLIPNGKLETIKGAEHGFSDVKAHIEKAEKLTVSFFFNNLKLN